MAPAFKLFLDLLYFYWCFFTWLFRHPTSGSFVRKEKISLGRSCPAAIRLRYGQKADSKDLEEELLQVKKAFNAPFLEMVGFDDVNKKLRYFNLFYLYIKKNNNYLKIYFVIF